MRYKLDASGYVSAVSFGCYLDDCTEYTGAVPTGYNSLDDWSMYACIQAYYIDSNGDLTLDLERQVECENRQAQESIDYAPLLRKDLYESEEVFDMQYVRKTDTGKVIALEDIKTIAPRVKITGVNPYEYSVLRVLTQGKNMMLCTAKTETISGVSFTRNPNGSITVAGTSTADIEYTIAESDYLFSLKANEDYYLNLGGFNCELFFVEDGEIAQQYIGASGLINVPEHIEVSKVVLKIASGQIVKSTFYPQLEYGKAFTSYAEYKCKSLDIDLHGLLSEILTPSETLYPNDMLYPRNSTTIDYILIQNGAITVSTDGVARLYTSGSVGLFASYSTIYANEDVMLEVEYSDNLMYVDSLEFLQGKATTTNQFKIKEDGSIEAHNGFFSGRIEADSGYFKGEISWEQITGNEDVATKPYVEGLGYQTAPQVTKITKDTVTTSFIKALNLTVGKEIQMGENAVISWDNVTNHPNIPTDTSQLTNGAGYQNASQVTRITKDTIDAPYINSLKVKAGSVDAENITGTTISGKTLKGVTGEFNGKITATSGTIGGMEIGASAIKYGKTSINDGKSGVYIGTDGIAIGYGGSTSSAFKVTSSGDVTIGTQGDVTIESGLLKLNSATSYIKHLTTNAIKFTGSTTNIISTYCILGKSGGLVGFFGDDGSAKKSVTTIASPTVATAPTVATKLNELINALKSYNLIG